MPTKRKFINKKNAVTFSLVHRSQRDPLVADENAPQRVLVPIREKSENEWKEKLKCGIYFDDDYNYLQHLREVNPKSEGTQLLVRTSTNTEGNKINLPSSVFESSVKEEVGLLNRAAPTGLRLDLDPDVVAGLDDDFDYDNPDNILEENFVQLANKPVSGSTEDVNEDNWSEKSDDVCSFDGEETKSRFTGYSMSSSVISRNSQLTLLDEKFENMFVGYDDSEIGPLDLDDIEGEINLESKMLLSAADEFEKEYKPKKLTDDFFEKIAEISEDESSDDEEYLLEVKREDKWDCESILSTYSNLYNHPQIIREPKVDKIRINNKTGMPCNSGKITKKSLAKLESEMASAKTTSSVVSRISLLSTRDPNESLEEKKTRKRQVKEYKRERRIERKANINAFKEEKRRLENAMVHNKLQCQGIRL